MRKLKLFFELVFIFIFPLIFMCFYLNIETVYTYDSDGNYQDSSKQITFDTIEIVNEVGSIDVLGYEYVYYDWEEFIFNICDEDFYSFDVDLNKIDFSSISYYQIYISQTNVLMIPLFDIFDSSNDIEYCYALYWSFDYSNDNSNYFLEFFINPCLITYDLSDFSVVNAFNDYYFLNDFDGNLPYFEMIDTYYIDFNDLDFDNFVYYMDCPFVKEVKPIEVIKYKNPLYDGLVKIEDMVGINTDSFIVEFINTYNCLWILMFAFWHLLYAFFELMVHIFDPKKYQFE